MTNSITTATLFLWIIPVFHITGAEMTCEFPDFLQSPEEDGVLQAWNTRHWWLHLRHKHKWAEKQHVYVKGSQMWRHREQNRKQCGKTHKRRSFALPFSSLEHCTEQRLVYNRTCIYIQADNKYRVLQYNSDRTHYYTCMRFVRRSSSIVQVYQGSTSETNDDNLCDDDKLIIDEWPWIAAKKKEPYSCPVQGGFTFRTIRRLTNEDFCADEWRSSHLEIECVVGDGLHFMTPVGSKCNPFQNHGHFKKLVCWAGWEEGDYIFLVAADSKEPKYCLRFPKRQAAEFSVLVYFSVICPTENDGKPHHGIEYYELRMRRKDTSVCEDEDEGRCKEVSKRNQCGKDKDFAKHCPRACALCNVEERAELHNPRCLFDPRLYGAWMLYEMGRSEGVHIARDIISFSQQGQFFCTKLLDEATYRYKTTLKFNNGCSERYTCFEFKSRRNNNLLQYRIGASYRKDKDDDAICQFTNDGYPLTTQHYSRHFKNLILGRSLWDNYCGLGSIIHFNGTFDGERCEGELGDWDQDTCSTKSTLTLRSGNCPWLNHKKFQCLDFMVPDKDSPVHRLITRSIDEKGEFNCWVISSHLQEMQWGPRVMYRMPTPQCFYPWQDAQVDSGWVPTATLYLDEKTNTAACKPEQQKEASTHATATKYINLKYNLPDGGKRDKDDDLLKFGSHGRPQADESSPTPLSGLQSRGSSAGCRSSYVLTTLLLIMAYGISSDLLSSSSVCLSVTSLVPARQR